MSPSFPRGVVLALCAVLGACGVNLPTPPPSSNPSPPPPSNPLVLKTGFDTSVPTLGQPRPALNQPFVDPNYGTTLARVTDPSQITDRDPPQWVRHEYSRKQAFNADSSRVLMISSNGWIRLYKVTGNTLAFVKTLNLGEPQEPIWHPTDPNLIYFLGPYGDGMTLSTYNILTDQKQVVRNLADRLRAIFGSQAARAWTKQEGRPSNDGKIWCLQVEDQNYAMLGLVAYDFSQDKILGFLLTKDRPDHVSTSPKGNYCVPSWGSPLGTRSYTLDFKSYQQLHKTTEHSDLALSAAGREVYVFADYDSGDVAMVDLATGSRTNLFRLYGPNSSATALHISGTASQKPGYALISFYACTEQYGATPCSYQTQWFNNKAIAVSLKPNPTLYNLAHLHTVYAGYFSEPQATVNPDFTKILFSSTWESSQENNVHDYLLELPSTALPNF